MPNTADAPLLRPGHNCWRVEPCNRFAMLVDGDAYFPALREALTRAEHTVFILGWDIDSRMRLLPDEPNDGLPAELRDFLIALCRRRRKLRVYVLSWDFAMVFALEREFLPSARQHWQSHRRLSFHLDGNHPPGASHHQKVVVIDHQLAFCGGLDLTIRRWDTHHHLADEPRRVDPDGKPYTPFHDVQCVVDGPAAAALGDIAAERWFSATGRRPRVPKAKAKAVPGPDRWPQQVNPDVTDVRVGISRTFPPRDDTPAINEIRALYVDAIAAARDHIYLENQYFSSGLIADAFEARLRDADGPDIALVSRRTESGWLEEASMGVLRARLCRELRDADPQGRFQLYCPHVPDLGDACVNVHSKVMAVDDRLLTIGSANLSNRSFGLDTECNVTLEANGDPRVAKAIRAMRDRLLCEHLAVTPEELAQAVQARPRLNQALAALHRPEGRTLQPFTPTVPDDIDAAVPDAALLDPIEPIDTDQIMAEFVSHEARPQVANRVAVLMALVLVVAGVAFAWRYTPLREWADFRHVLGIVQDIGRMPLAPLAMVGVFVAGGLLMVPVTVLIVVTVVVFGPLYGAAVALAGTVLSTAATYTVGRLLGRNAVQRFGGTRLNRLSQQVGQHGLLAMVVLRLVPVAPFTLVNLVVGASRIRLRDCLLGTAIGMTPGILLSASLVNRIAAAARDPNAITFALLGLVLLIPAGLWWVLRRRRRRRSDAAAQAAEAARWGTPGQACCTPRAPGTATTRPARRAAGTEAPHAGGAR
ncbi:VTT domain-containing protein [Cupriavidus agavae]|uniref:Phospholipase D1/2 n=1 Tax=Cupriavidus agavae TaxID=1001822 RepID=A0A4V2FEY0_9BURK|nr:VTT domain-containing protein [Cupriavidus agavae]RZT31349.1 phospholipase D1/2 [Cupriavidus agavae]